MIACAYCSFGTIPQMIVAGSIFGGWAAQVFVLSPLQLSRRMKQVWGFPRFQISDFISLSILMIVPLLVIKHGQQELELFYLGTVGTLLLMAVVYVWLRGLWILQQLDVNHFLKRTLFISILWPVMFCFCIMMGLISICVISVFLFGRLEVILFVVPLGLIAWILLAICRAGLSFVFEGYGKVADPNPNQQIV